MKVAYSRPKDFTLTVVGTDAAIVSSPVTAITNGRPADATRLQVPSDWTGSISGDVVILQFTRATAFTPGLVGIVGLNALDLDTSAGLKFSFVGRRASDVGFTYNLGGNTALVRSYERGDGSIIALGMCADGLDPVIGIQVTIYNDQNGSANLDAAAFIDLGDFWASPATWLPLAKGWELSTPQGTVPTSENGQPWPAPFPPGATLPITIPLQTFSDAFLSTMAPNYRQLVRLLGNGECSIFIPRYKDASGALDVETMHATAMFVTCQLQKIAHNGGPKHTITGTIKEVPALLAE